MNLEIEHLRDELRRVRQENDELRLAVARAMELYKSTAEHRDRLFGSLLSRSKNEDSELLDYLQNSTAETEPHPNGDEMLWCVSDGEGFWHKSTDLRKAIRLAMNLDAINAREEDGE